MIMFDFILVFLLVASCDTDPTAPSTVRTVSCSFGSNTVLRCHKIFLPFFILELESGQYFFYRSMHYSAKRGLAIACRLSDGLSMMLVDHDHIG